MTSGDFDVSASGFQKTPPSQDLGQINLENIDWVIVGGESGAGARLVQPSWVHNIRKQCHQAHVPFFFKQWGGVRKKEAGRELNGKTYDQFPERALNPVLPQTERQDLIKEFELTYPLELWS